MQPVYRVTVGPRRTWQSSRERQVFTAVRSEIFPLGQGAASLLVNPVVEQGEAGEVLGGDDSPAQVEQ